MDTVDKINALLEVTDPKNIGLSNKILKMRMNKKGITGAITPELGGIRRYMDKLSLAVKAGNSLVVKRTLREMISDLNRISKLVK